MHKESIMDGKTRGERGSLRGVSIYLDLFLVANSGLSNVQALVIANLHSRYSALVQCYSVAHSVLVHKAKDDKRPTVCKSPILCKGACHGQDIEDIDRGSNKMSGSPSMRLSFGVEWRYWYIEEVATVCAHRSVVEEREVVGQVVKGSG